MANNQSSIIDAITEGVAKNLQNSGNANTVALKLNERVAIKMQKQKDFANRIRSDMARNKNCVTITIPQMYSEYMPSTKEFSINNCSIVLKADGQPKLVHKEFAALVRAYLKRLDDKVAYMRKQIDNTEIRSL